MKKIARVNRRFFCVTLAAGIGAGASLARGQAATGAQRGSPILTPPRIVGPIPVTQSSIPFASTAKPGTFTAGLLKKYDYVEEEYFLFGHANLYGPGVKGQQGRTVPEAEQLQPLAGLVKPRMPYATRLLLVRPRDNAKFSGRVLAYTFHNLNTNMYVEPNFLRNGDVVLGVEGNTGARYGPDELPRGGVTALHEFDLDRYRDLALAHATPAVWPGLRPGSLANRKPDDGGIFVQEMSRAYAQAPDIMTQVAHALKLNHPSLPFAGKVKTLVNYAASGGSTFLTRYIDYHHEAARLPDGRPAFDGYMVSVGIIPHTRPKDAVLVYVMSEDDMKSNLKFRDKDPPDTDNPRYRAYQIPAAGHILSAALPGSEVNPADRDVPEGIHYYDKVNKPIIWGLWQGMFDWIERDKPMLHAPPLQIDNAAADRIARDQHGNALGGLRTPWVDVPDGVYVTSVSPQNRLRAGYRPFDEAKMRQLYGTRERYVVQVNRRIDRMVRDGWVAPQDAAVMKLSK